MYHIPMRLILTTLLVLLPLCAQETPPKQAKQEAPAPTNLKVLKVTTGGDSEPQTAPEPRAGL